jgi:cytochrome c-type biogenesis protein
MILGLIIPVFIAGILTFLAPCTLPLVPGYLGFISGTSLKDLKDVSKVKRIKRKVFVNGLLYVIGFSAVFVLMGSLAGLAGSLLVNYQAVLSKVGGLFVILFGLIMLQSAVVFYAHRWPVLKRFKIPMPRLLQNERRFKFGSFMKPGNPFSSILFGAAFAVGWTPCVGPILGTVLTLAATKATVLQGALLLGVFSLGLALPFLVLAAGIGYFVDRIQWISKILPVVSVIGGLFLIFLGFLVFSNKLGIWIAFFFNVFRFIEYDSLLRYL